ncbi:MAG: bifunctional diaminohydroxyphosphoribosylaminopyrimidine deaminase/5-amino-6-(5-phosphoribosylamino)uracil reductase RibD, partial [Spirochaetaceae bacterium]|nr:bifunctional diaminohydroxyphosphoribosylaminopyrimidine deaminase/5-amino-6-(5-phosphoribosylamino)uracil reductase RibD [Spirochaetaceae bacterium]
HEKYGGPHAEINAINSVYEEISGSTIYVTLEPCFHTGKTPPCVDAIIRKKFKKVVIGMSDPNPLVSGKSIQKLIDHNIGVETGVLEKECRKINEIFIKFITTSTPFVIMKSAMTLDGKIAAYTGNSKRISCEDSRYITHKLRHRMSAIMVGIGTVLADDPELTSRIENGKDPIRIVVDSKLRIPLNAKILRNNIDLKTIIATTVKAPKRKIEILKKMNVRVIILRSSNRGVDLQELMKKLAEIKIDSILLEGGGILNYSALEEGIVDKALFFIAPKIIGGHSAKTPVEGSGKKTVGEAFNLVDIAVSTIGSDVLIEGSIKRSVS